jgi:hypothetical protein
MSSSRRRLLAAGIAAVGAGAALTAALLIDGPQQEAGDRQQEVAERGRTVMPFDLDETTHRFTPTGTGGVQDVVADRLDDARQIELIRVHLRQEAAAFTKGDFGDPARIHGDDMPGLAELKGGHEHIEVRYRERADGATLTYDTRDPALVDALHAWFEAQLGDHGDHAESGH